MIKIALSRYKNDIIFFNSEAISLMLSHFLILFCRYYYYNNYSERCKYPKISYILEIEILHVYSCISHVWHVRHQSYSQDRHFWHRSRHVPSDLASARDVLGNNRPITLAMAFWNLDQTRQVLLVRAHHDLKLAMPKLEDAPGLSNGASLPIGGKLFREFGHRTRNLQDSEKIRCMNF